ncbi:MAG: type III-B CRISPR module RAMP protein Cmr6 [Puniceicoccaceae bacterium]
MKPATARDTAELLGTTPIAHPSLLADKFLLPAGFRNTPEEKEDSLKAICTANASYVESKRRLNALANEIISTHGSRAGSFFANLRSRMAVNLAEGLLENAGICLDRNTGVPFLPASAIKGCCHAAAYWMEKEGKLQPGLTEKLFGTTERQGMVTFLPAFPIEACPLTLDILTPHPRGNGVELSPIPNKYPVIDSGAKFQFIYFFLRNQPSEQIGEYHAQMSQIFEQAFDAGFGAKTGTGLGWFRRDFEHEKQDKVERERVLEAKAKEIAEAKRLKKEEIDLANKRAEQERKRKIAEENGRIKEEAESRAYEAAGPLERLRMDLMNCNKDALKAKVRRVPETSPEENKVLLEVLLERPNTLKKLMRESNLKSLLQSAAKELKINLP